MREPDEAVTRPVEDDPTLAEPLGRKSRSSIRTAPQAEADGGPSGARPSPRTRGSSSRATTISNPSDAARWDEIARTRALSVLGVVGSLSLSLVAPFFEVDSRILCFGKMASIKDLLRNKLLTVSNGSIQIQLNEDEGTYLLLLYNCADVE